VDIKLKVILFVLMSFGFVDAQTKRFIIKTKSVGGFSSGLSITGKKINLQALSLEVDREIDSVKKNIIAEDLGMLLLEGDEEEIKLMLKNHPLVSNFEQDIKWTIQETDDCDEGSNDPSSDDCSPWVEDVLGLTDINNSAIIDSPSSSSDIVVAVIDTGSKITHPYLQSALYLNNLEASGSPGVDDDGNGYVDDVHGYNFAENNSNVREYDTDHGSHVSGIVKTVRDKAIRAGYDSARKIKILPIKFISGSEGSTFGAVSAIQYAISRGAEILNVSWGSRGFSAYSKILYDALAVANNSDIFISAASGNSDCVFTNNNDNDPFFPSQFKLPSLMSVGSATALYRYGVYPRSIDSIAPSCFSNYGTESVDIYSVGSYQSPEGNLSGIWSLAGNESNSDLLTTKKGTSMAAPVVSGIAAVVKSINPLLSAADVKKLIIQTGVQSSSYNNVASSKISFGLSAFEAASSFSPQGVQIVNTNVDCLKAFDGFVCDSSGTSSASDGSNLSGTSGGGCGTIGPVDGEGPLSGNSVLLFTMIYFLFRLFRNRFKLNINRSLSV